MSVISRIHNGNAKNATRKTYLLIICYLVARCGKDHVGVLSRCGDGGDPSTVSKKSAAKG